MAEFVGRDLNLAGLNRAADAVAAAYREAGWLVRVYLPTQDIGSGVVTLQVVEARFGGMRFEGAPPTLVDRAEIESFFRAQQRKDAWFNLHATDRALLLADDLPGVSVAGTLTPGAQDAETTVVVQTTDEPFIYGDIGLDNHGARATGTERLTANLSINSPGGRGELISLNLLHTQGSDYGRAALTVPHGHNGLRLGLSATSLNYKVIQSGFASTAQIQGTSTSLGLDWSYPLVRARMSNLYLLGGLENKAFFTQDTQVRSRYESDSLRLGLSGNRFDELGGGGANSASVQLLWGRLTAMQAHNQLDTIGRRYHKISYSASRQQALGGPHSLLLSLTGQYANQLLDSSERFYIGGAQTVRAYPTSERGGDRGQALSAEWRWRIDGAWVLGMFADAGRVSQLPMAASDQHATYTLRGHGLAVQWQGPAGLTAKLAWSQRDGSPSAAPLTGGNPVDGDGPLQRDRFWLALSVPF